jgi:hypothetical protein
MKTHRFKINYKYTPEILSRSKRNAAVALQEGEHLMGFISDLIITTYPDKKFGSPDVHLRLQNIQK